MKMASTIALIIFGTVALVMSSVAYGLYADNKRLVVKNQLLEELYDVSIKNVDTLEKTIDEQNQKIDKFKSESVSFELKVNELNMEVTRLNEQKEEYARMEPEKADTAEEAVNWLKSQAASLQ